MKSTTTTSHVPTIACLESLFYSNRNRVFMNHKHNSSTTIPHYEQKHNQGYRPRRKKETFIFKLEELLPDDLFSYIFQFLKVKDILNLEQVSIQWKCFVQDEYLWKCLAVSHLRKYSISEHDIEMNMKLKGEISFREFLLNSGILQASWFESVIRSLHHTHAVLTFRITGYKLKTILFHHNPNLKCNQKCSCNKTNMNIMNEVFCSDDHFELRDAMGTVLLI
jgi:hypothetical protein